MAAISVGIIGIGNAARQHLEAVENTDDINVVAICDPLMSNLATLPVWAGGLRILTLEELLSDATIQIIAICTPPGNHASLTVNALRSGKAVVVEKPAATSLGELEYMLRERNAAKLPVAVMHQHRFALPVEALSVGWSSETTATVEVYRNRPRAYFESAPWRTEPELSAGAAFAHLGVHYADLACQLLGEPIDTKGFASCDLVPANETRVALAVRFESGALLSFLCDCMAATRMERLCVRDREMHFEIINGAWKLCSGPVEIRAKPTSRTLLRSRVYQEVRQALASGHFMLPVTDIECSKGVVQLLETVRKMTVDRP